MTISDRDSRSGSSGRTTDAVVVGTLGSCGGLQRAHADQVVGRRGEEKLPVHAGTSAMVDDLFIRLPFRRAGLATAALAEVRAFCVRGGIRAIHVETGMAQSEAARDRIAQALRLAERLGGLAASVPAGLLPLLEIVEPGAQHGQRFAKRPGHQHRSCCRQEVVTEDVPGE